MDIKILTHEEFDRRVLEAMKPPANNPANKSPLPSKDQLMAAAMNNKKIKVR
ncbi:MAG: hypothetical protein WC455_16235 [Dehalococcoidia bacterium]|jgi:hypothetical protein